jgi:hypothetical protein
MFHSVIVICILEYSGHTECNGAVQSRFTDHCKPNQIALSTCIKI